MARWGRPAVVLLAGVAVILVAMAAAGSPLRVSGRRTSDAVTAPSWLLLVPLVGFVLFAVGLVVLLREDHGPRRTLPRRSIFPTLAAIAFAALLATLVGRPSDDRATDEPASAVVDTVPPPPDEPGERSSWPMWTVVALSGVIALAAGAVHVRRPRPALPPADATVPDGGRGADPAVTALRESADELYATEDPRAGVIAAYVRLLEGLGGAGVSRRPEEAPFEHVTRALQRLGVRREPLERLAALFAEARFSNHRITEPQRAEAMVCLQACLDDLRTVPCG
jgi:hypothetical protein